MSALLESLSHSYRDFDEDNLPYRLSKRLLSPVIFIERKRGKYQALLGAQIRKGDKVDFIPCSSNSHNWIFHNNTIKSLPYDIPIIINDTLKESNLLDLKFAVVLSLFKTGIEGVDVIVDPDIFETANNRSIQLSIPNSIPKLNAELFPYQNHGVAWMKETLEHLGGVILADEMGLGKTLQIITLLLLDEPRNEAPALIICPTTLIANWCQEIKKFAPTLSVLVHRGLNRTGFYKNLMRSQVVITTYDTLVNDITIFRGVEWHYLICDEAQAVKNPESKRRLVLDRLNRKYTIPVTGTPMENTLMDIWSLSDLAIPGVLGTKENFGCYYPDTESGATELCAVVDSIILKRQVKDVATDLPERTDVDFPIELDENSLEEYERIKSDAITDYGLAGQLVAVGQLAIFCAHPWLRAKNINIPDLEKTEINPDPSYQLFTPKMKVCIRLLKEAFLNEKKVIIFAAYNNLGDLIQKASNEEGLNYEYWNSINGSTPQEERQSIVDEFSKVDGAGALVLNPKAAGSGLNITAATIVIHYTQNWNPALEMQASARSHRRGQKNPVTVYRLYYQGTVEETMIERSQWKRELSNSAVPINTRDNTDLNNALTIRPNRKQSK
jgi:SNF2 family DNA or RNA helicase